ncbi:unnamed protein product [Prunus armeniaca]|uniref:Uncharacterized protein n=1 Tax=Prunus armeniaca TaxID=36596 RepID=A0A6J5UUU2_PRUAR|nr:unnamed protein product [Prunus armeniaca]CAB4310231.1 unnamed protein product [Prunus armeniaca]
MKEYHTYQDYKRIKQQYTQESPHLDNPVTKVKFLFGHDIVPSVSGPTFSSWGEQFLKEPYVW